MSQRVFSLTKILELFFTFASIVSKRGFLDGDRFVQDGLYVTELHEIRTIQNQHSIASGNITRQSS